MKQTIKQLACIYIYRTAPVTECCTFDYSCFGEGCANMHAKFKTAHSWNLKELFFCLANSFFNNSIDSLTDFQCSLNIRHFLASSPIVSLSSFLLFSIGEKNLSHFHIFACCKPGFNSTLSDYLYTTHCALAIHM